MRARFHVVRKPRQPEMKGHGDCLTNRPVSPETDTPPPRNECIESQCDEQRPTSEGLGP